MNCDCGHDVEKHVYIVHESQQTHCEACMLDAITCEVQTLVRRISVVDYRLEEMNRGKSEAA